MKTITADQYQILHYMDCSYGDYEHMTRLFGEDRIKDLIRSGLAKDVLKDCGWCDEYIRWRDEYILEITPKGRMEFNIYLNRVIRDNDPKVKAQRWSSGHPKNTCPRCGDTTDDCPICCGYHLSKETNGRSRD